MKTPRIGLCWKGSPTHTNDRLRSIPDQQAMTLFSVPGVEWQSLQYKVPVPESCLPCPTGDFRDTAEAIASCDLVITVDTSVAHLAGSLGVETWLLLPVLAEWRWMQDREDSPWYPSMRLVRQDEGGWGPLLDRVRADLVTYLNARTILANA